MQDREDSRADTSETSSKASGPAIATPGERRDVLEPTDPTLAGRDLRDMDFTGADLEGADLSGSDLSGVSLLKANLKGANLSRANLTGAELAGADLTDAHLEEVQAANAGFGMAALKGARLFGAKLEGATFSKSDLSGADLRCAELRGARFRESNLTDCDFTSADLAAADLGRAVVTGASFRNVEIREARLRALEGFMDADWIGVDIHSINFAGAYRLRRFVIDQNYLKEFRESSRVSGILYWVWWATSDCGRSLVRWGVWIAVLTGLFAGLYSVAGVDFGPDATPISALYFSVITFTTLGYGDIVPVTSLGQSLAMIEVFFGYVMLGGLLSIFSNIIARRGE